MKENETERWLNQALDDLRFIDDLYEKNDYFDKVCFMAQQATEKALKAILFYSGERVVFGHSTKELLKEIRKKYPKFPDFSDHCSLLDRHYLPARYPNALPGGSPYSIYSKKDMIDAVTVAKEIIRSAQSFLEKKTNK